jgi:uncharacterized protein YodC (DUF2158 family)
MSDTPTEITPGTLVKLKSGGPRMTVTIVEDDVCNVVYFCDRQGFVEIDGLPVAALRIVPEGEAA